jgi:protein-L-isoaspartate(D-aspartate) O-methyltransferase
MCSDSWAGDVDDYDSERQRMVDEQIAARGLSDARLLQVLRAVPRHRFVPNEYRAMAYSDGPLPIGKGQTISQPYIVAYMTEALRLGRSERVLEIGTGSGYQTAVLAEVAGEVWTVELVEELSLRAQAKLGALGYGNVRFRIGDGSGGWPEAAPFDGILVTAAPTTVPEDLEGQLAPGGRMIIPVGLGAQELVLVERVADSFRRRRLLGVRFVPLVRRGTRGHDGL